MTNASMPQAGPGAQKTFDFVKRKRWAELLVSELADGINIILSASCTVLYCGPAITELIGWRDTDLIDRDMLELVIPDDHAIFRTCFQESLNKDSEFLAYIRFKRNESLSSNALNRKDILFEVKGQPRVLETEGKLFFATAKPYPSRNTDMLNTFLELKIENEQLQRRLFELQNCLPEHASTSPLGPVPNQAYTTSSNHSRRPSASGVPPQRNTSLYGPSCWTIFDNPFNTIDNNFFGDEAIRPSPPSGDDDTEGSKKKKLKKSHITEQYVCTKCGRTDSPEWRKGPHGPKTLCNACGLRWAKQVRKTDDTPGDSLALGDSN